MKSALHDVRFAVRSLRKSPRFAASVLLSIALGIGGTGAVFGVIYVVNFRTLPFEAPEELVAFMGATSEKCAEACPDGFSRSQYELWKPSIRSFRSMAAYEEVTNIIQTSGGAVRVSGAVVSGDFFTTLRTNTLTGRYVVSADDHVSAEPVVVLSHRLWAERFASEKLLGSPVLIGAKYYTVIGVMPQEFTFPVGADYWLPLHVADDSPTNARQFSAVARLRPGVGIQAARTELRSIVRSAETSARTEPRQGIAVFDVNSISQKLDGSSLLFMGGTVLFAFVIACANVQMLFLVRAMGRTNEIALRASLGASSSQIAKQLVTESLVITVAGGILGCIIAIALSKPAAALVAHQLNTPITMHVGVGFLLSIAVVSIVTGTAVGLSPMLHLRSLDLRTVLQETSASVTTSGGHRRVRAALVTFEISCVLILVTAGGALAKSVGYLHGLGLGYDLDRILVASIDFRGTQHSMPATARSLATLLVDRLSAVPGIVSAAAWSTSSPYGLFEPGEALETVEGRSSPLPAGCSKPSSCWQPFVSEDVSPGFFRTLGISIERGRDFATSDGIGSVPVAIISKRTAALWWPGEDPIGRRFKWGPPSSQYPWMEVIAVTADAYDPNERGLTSAAAYPGQYYPLMFRPLSQTLGNERGPEWASPLRVLMKTARDGHALQQATRSEISRIAPDVLVERMSTLRELIRAYGQYNDFRLNAEIVGGVGLFGILLAVIGLEGVVADGARRRRKEIAIRMALGAQSKDVLLLALKEGASLSFVGVLFGIAVIFAISGTIGKIFFLEGQYSSPLMQHPSATDPCLIGAAVVFVFFVVTVGAAGPAIRSSRASSLSALRED